MPRINIGLSRRVRKYPKDKKTRLITETKNVGNILIRGNFNALDFTRKVLHYILMNHYEGAWHLEGYARSKRRRSDAKAKRAT